MSIHLSASKSNSLVLIASKMPGNHWGRFEHGSTMLWCIQVPGALAEQLAQILCCSFCFSWHLHCCWLWKPCSRGYDCRSHWWNPHDHQEEDVFTTSPSTNGEKTSWTQHRLLSLQGIALTTCQNFPTCGFIFRCSPSTRAGYTRGLQDICHWRSGWGHNSHTEEPRHSGHPWQCSTARSLSIKICSRQSNIEGTIWASKDSQRIDPCSPMWSYFCLCNHVRCRSCFQFPCDGEECLLCAWGPETWTHFLWHQLWCEATSIERPMVQGCWDVCRCLALSQQTCYHPSVLSLAALQSCSISQVNGRLWKVVLQYVNHRTD